jgi:phosphatidylserine decarboxylase
MLRAMSMDDGAPAGVLQAIGTGDGHVLGGLAEGGAPWAAVLQAMAADPPALAAVREGAPLTAAVVALGLAAWRRQRVLGAGLLALAAWSAWFFRDPPRRCPGEPDLLYAPADGVIVAVDEVDWDWYIHGRALRIATFLSPLDVHVNRSPAAGRLVAYRREPGAFAPAFLTGHAERNARQLLAIERGLPRAGEAAEGDRIVVAQITGMVARRIVSWRLPGDPVAAGQKLGMIRFGSRTDLLAPAGVASPLVATGLHVRAGLTPVARYRTAR